MAKPVAPNVLFGVLLGTIIFTVGLIACSSITNRHPKDRIKHGKLNTGEAILTEDIEKNPNSPETRISLGETYYQAARKALDDEQDEGKYLSLLERSTNQFVIALELDPSDSRPHFFLAMIDAYRGDLPSALRGFNNARKLHPVGVSYTNIAEILIYMGRLQKAYEWNDLGLRKNAPYGAYLFNEMLIAWKEGDIKDAEDNFFTLKENNPEYISTVNVSELSKPPETFEKFAQYCCNSPACGPYMVEACTDLSFRVQKRSLSKKALLRELKIEIERSRRLKVIYEQRKELEITIETPTSRDIGLDK